MRTRSRILLRSPAQPRRDRCANAGNRSAAVHPLRPRPPHPHTEQRPPRPTAALHAASPYGLLPQAHELLSLASSPSTSSLGSTPSLPTAPWINPNRSAAPATLG